MPGSKCIHRNLEWTKALDLKHGAMFSGNSGTWNGGSGLVFSELSSLALPKKSVFSTMNMLMANRNLQLHRSHYLNMDPGLEITWSWNLCYDAHCASFCTVIHGHPTSSVGFRPGNAMQARLFMQSLVLPLNSSKLISSSIGLDNSVRCIWDNMGSRFDWQHAVASNLLCLECIQMLVPYCKWATST